MVFKASAALTIIFFATGIAAATALGATPIQRIQPELWLADAPGWMGMATAPARVGVHVIVGKDGRVSRCSVTDSSGIADLDQAACWLVTINARYRPATDDAGRPIGSQDQLSFVIDPDPGNLSHEENYPLEALRRNQQGTVHAMLRIGSDGHVKSCQVTISSGSKYLDKDTCTKLISRFRAIPPQDSEGNYMEFNHEEVMIWKIP